MPRPRLLAILLILSLAPAIAAPLASRPLPPGKPAGVRKAQEARTYGAIGALALIAIGGFAFSGHPYRIPGTPAPATSTQP